MMIKTIIDPRIAETPEDSARVLLQKIHRAEVEQARLDGSIEQRAQWEEASYALGYNSCLSDILKLLIDFQKGNITP